MVDVENTDPQVQWGSEPINPKDWSLPALKIRYILKRLPLRGRLLEVGSGEGRILKTLARHRSGLELYGSDVRTPLTPTEGYRFRVMTERIPFEDKSFDLVVVVDALEHAAEPPRILTEIRRVLTPTGLFIGFVPVEGERWSAYALMRSLWGWDLYVQTKHHVQAFTHSGLRELMERQFRIVDWRYAYHGLGQSLDAGFFALSRWEPVSRFWWQENPYYRPAEGRRSWLGRGLRPMLSLGNVLACAESRLLENTKLGAAGVLFAVKPR